MNRFWMVWNESGGPPSVKHSAESTAVHEAERLARLSPDSRFFVLRAELMVQKREVDIVRLDEDDDGVPF